MTEKMDRKEFFRSAFSMAFEMGAAVFKKAGIAEKLESLTNTPPSQLSPIKQRPPGASHTEKEFLSKCTGCDACMAACPVHVILIEDLEQRDPVLFPNSSPCIHCPGYPCISSCPTGALDKGNGINLRKF